MKSIIYGRISKIFLMNSDSKTGQKNGGQHYNNKPTENIIFTFSITHRKTFILVYFANDNSSQTYVIIVLFYR